MSNSELLEITAAKTMAGNLKLPVVYAENQEICLSLGRNTTLTIGRTDGFVPPDEAWTLQLEFRLPQGKLRTTAKALGPQLALAFSNVASALLGNAPE